MLRFSLKKVIKSCLVAAVVASPMVAGAQPFTLIVQFTDAITVGSPLVPIAAPTAPGNYGFCIYVARGGPGVAAIDPAASLYPTGGSVRVYYTTTQMSDPTQPGAANANIQLDATGAARPSAFGAALLAAAADTGAFTDGQASTDRRRQANVNFAVGTGPLKSNPVQLPSDWAYSDPNNAPGTFEPLVTLNTTVLPGATFPLNVGVTMQSASGGFSTAFVQTDATGSTQVPFSNQNQPNTLPLSVDLTSLTGSVVGDTATISWSTAAEYDNAGFVVYRVEANGDQGEAISTLVAAEGSAASGASYSVVDPAPLAPGESRSYYLSDIDLSGATTTHGPVSVTRGAASAVAGWELY